MMSILDFISQSAVANTVSNTPQTPLEAFQCECDKLESKCADLDLVRRAINLKTFDFKLDEMDYKINYDLGFVYDPLFRVREWHTQELSKKVHSVTYPDQKQDHFIHKRELNPVLDDWLVACRGYNDKPWYKPMECRYDNDFNGWFKQHYLFYKQCCLRQDWQGFVTHHLTYIQSNLKKYLGQNVDFEVPSNWFDIITGHLKNYFKIDVMGELLWRRKNLKLYRHFRTYTEEEPTKFECCIGKFKGFQYKTYGAKGIKKFKADQVYTATGKWVLENFGVNIDKRYAKSDSRWLQELYKVSNQCYNTYHMPQLVLKYESYIVVLLEQYKFWNAFATMPLNAETCFKLYVMMLRTRISVSPCSKSFEHGDYKTSSSFRDYVEHDILLI